MDLQTTLTGFPNAAPLDGLDQAWKWSMGPVLHFAGVLSKDGTRLMQTNQRGRHDEELARGVLAFAREHEQALIGTDRPIAAVPGFSADGYAFDAVAATAPEVHGHHKAQNPDLTAVTYIVFPAFATEVSGRESLEEAQARYQKMLSPAEIGREAVPFLKMSFDNPRTGGGSTNPGRALTYPRMLRQEIPQLEGALGGFVEWENRTGEVRRVAWDGEWVLSEAAGERRGMSLDEILEFSDETLRA
ncbi:hypothetical protein HTV80_34280 [Streptomyces sp. Vc74B-19]|uniref:hypothetical protein n=1 Tax=unclassified Streptomyces TaxID=2593676 RepID=UPI001BFC1025|nr:MULTISPECIES: hypothetical protein [unclassified Streptomyces]MBT3168121.1 hypothetical protein [Streptomyces sp. Vc74B-19]MDU0303575.1 hypothetical protein [Streptomyces sp. PAL114]